MVTGWDDLLTSSFNPHFPLWSVINKGILYNDENLPVSQRPGELNDVIQR